MYCGSCDSIPFWRWLKLNQKFSTSITCYDYNGEKLFNLQPNDFTDCFSEYLSTFGFESVIKFIAYTLRIATRFYGERFDDTKCAIRSCKPKDRQHNGKQKKDKMTNNDL